MSTSLSLSLSLLPAKCILDVGGAAAQLAVIVSGISAAVGDCKSGAAVDDLFARLVGFVVNGLQRGDQREREREEATRMSTGAPTNWSDCGLPNATMHIDLISSTNPVHKGEQQSTCAGRGGGAGGRVFGRWGRSRGG